MRLLGKIFGSADLQNSGISRDVDISQIMPDLERIVSNADHILAIHDRTGKMLLLESHPEIPEDARIVLRGPRLEYNDIATFAVFTVKTAGEFFKILPRDSMHGSNQYGADGVTEVAEEWVMAQLQDFCGIEDPQQAMEAVTTLDNLRNAPDISVK